FPENGLGRPWEDSVDGHHFVATAICGGRYFDRMLTIRIAGSNLVDARRLLGWSRYELARRSGVNHRTLKSYELAGDIAPASVGRSGASPSSLKIAIAAPPRWEARPCHGAP